jgi:cation-transporting ATPase 13A2
MLNIYTECGYRVIALAHKPLDMSKIVSYEISREEVESQLYFLGFMIMQNKLKDATTGVI